MAHRLDQRGGDECESAEQRQRVPVNRAEQAVKPVEAEPLLDVDRRLDRGEHERGDDEEGRAAQEHRQQAQVRRLAAPGSQAMAFAYPERREPQHGSRKQRREPEHDRGDHDRPRPARDLPEGLGPRVGRKRIGKRAGDEHDRRNHEHPSAYASEPHINAP